MRFILPTLLFATLSFGDQIITNSKTGEKLSLYNKSWAVIIGINKYKNTRELNYAVQDAESIKSMLIADYKFPESNIKMLTNDQATRETIRESIYDVIQKASEDDQILIFFAGHGETEVLPTGGEMGYLLPVEGEPSKLYLTALPMSEIKSIANMTRAKHVLFLVDACYGGLATIDARGLKPSTSGYLDKITRGKARQIITAGSKGEEVIEKAEWGHSVFTRNILRGLKNLMADINSDGAVTAEELGVYLKDKVTIDSEQLQTPQIRRFESGDGEFVFAYEGKSNKTSMPSSQSIAEITLDYEKLAEEIVNQQLKQATSDTTADVPPNINTQINNDTTDDATLYQIHENKLVTKSNFVALLESDTVETERKIKYVFGYASDYIKKKYYISNNSNFGYNRVDGLYLLPGIKWEPPKPNKIAVGLQGGYSFAAQRPQYELSLNYYWIKTDNFEVKTFGEIYDVTNSYDYWRTSEFVNSYWYSSNFGYDFFDYFHNQGFTTGLTTKGLVPSKWLRKGGVSSFFSIQYFQETHLPLEKKTDWSMIVNHTPRDNIFNPDSMTATKLNGIKVWVPGMNKWFNNKRCHECKHHMESFHYTPQVDTDSISVTLIAESRNWSKKQYVMEKKGDDFEVSVDLREGMYYYRFHVDTMLITDPNAEANNVFNNGDSLSVRNVGKSILPLLMYEFGRATTDSSFNYWTAIGGAVISYPINPHNEIRVRLFTQGSYFPLPTTKLAYIGGLGSLRGYEFNEFEGSTSEIINLEFERSFFLRLTNKKRRLQKIGLMLFFDYASIGSLHRQELSWNKMFDCGCDVTKTSFGFGINLDDIKILAAKRMDRDKDDWSILIEFRSFINREYPYPR